MSRIGLGSLLLPAISLDDPVQQIMRVATFCVSSTPGEPASTHHLPIDLGDGQGFLAELADLPLLDVAQVFFTCVLHEDSASIWIYPPLRGPPERQASALFSRGPPDLT